MRVVTKTEYHLKARHTQLTVCVVVILATGAGRVSGYIWEDWPRMARIDAYLATVPGLLWERGDTTYFVYSFGEGALSGKTAVDLDTIVQAPHPKDQKATRN